MKNVWTNQKLGSQAIWWGKTQRRSYEMPQLHWEQARKRIRLSDKAEPAGVDEGWEPRSLRFAFLLHGVLVRQENIVVEWHAWLWIILREEGKRLWAHMIDWLNNRWFIDELFKVLFCFRRQHLSVVLNFFLYFVPMLNKPHTQSYPRLSSLNISDPSKWEIFTFGAR